MISAHFTSPKHWLTKFCSFICQHLSCQIPFRFIPSFAKYGLVSGSTLWKITRYKIRRPWGPLTWSMVPNPHLKFLISNINSTAPKLGEVQSCCQDTLPRPWCCSVSSITVLCRTSRWLQLQSLHLKQALTHLPSKFLSTVTLRTLGTLLGVYHINKHSCVNLLFHLSWTLLRVWKWPS